MHHIILPNELQAISVDIRLLTESAAVNGAGDDRDVAHGVSLNMDQVRKDVAVYQQEADLKQQQLVALRREETTHTGTPHN